MGRLINSSLRIGTLRGRLAFFFALVMALSLSAFAATVYGIVVAVESEDDDPTGEEQRELLQIRRRVLLALGVAVPVGLTIAVGGGALITRKAFRSLSDVVHTAAALGAENVHARLPSFAGAGAEVEQVAAALNGMLERLDQAVSGLRRFTENAAHELRTPLTVLLGNLEICLRRPHDTASVQTTLEETFEELERLTQLVEALLTLARSDAGALPLRAASLDATAVASQVIDLYETVANERNVALRLHGPAPVPLFTDPLWLSRILVNLIDNACKFTGSGARIDVHIEPETGGARLVVQDTGPGISEADRARIFERFFRGASERSAHAGFGLGLALAHELAKALGGSLHLTPRPDGRPGARFLLQVPDQPRRRAALDAAAVGAT